MKRHTGYVGLVGIDLAEIDELVGSLWLVRTQTDDLEADLAVAVELVGEGTAVGPVLRSIGDDCFHVGGRIKLGADRLRAFQFHLPSRGFVPLRGGRGHPTAGLRRPWRESTKLSPPHPTAVSSPEVSSPEVSSPDVSPPDVSSPDVSSPEGHRLYESLVGLGLGPSESRTVTNSFHGRDAWDDLYSLDVDLTDPEAFDPFSPAIFAVAFPELLAASKKVNEHILGPNRRPMPGRKAVQHGLHHARGLLSEDDLVRIAENPELTGELAAIAALVLHDRKFLAALDGAGQRRGDILGGQAIDAEDRMFSIDDLTALNNQRLIALSLGPVRHEIDTIGGGGQDGTRSKHDYQQFAEEIRMTHPELAALTDQVVDAGLFDLGGWDKTADWASTAGLVLAAAALAVAVVGTGGLAAPAAVAALSAVAAGTELAAGVKTKDTGHIVGGGLGVAGGGATVVRSMLGLRAGVVGIAAGFDDDALKVIDNVNDFNGLLAAADAVPTLSLSETETVVAPFRLTPGEWYQTFGDGIRAAPGSVAKFAPHIEGYATASTNTRFVPDTWTVDQLPRLNQMRQVIEVVDTAIETGAAPLAGLLAGEVHRRRHEDDDEDPRRARPPVPEPGPPKPIAEPAATGQTAGPVPSRTPTPDTQPVTEPAGAPAPAPTPQPKPTPVGG